MVLDLETTGLPMKTRYGKFFNYKNIAKYSTARIVQISYGIYEANGTLKAMIDNIIRPNGFVIPDIAISIHNISNEIANSEGISLKDAINTFRNHIATVDAIIGHNVKFDINVLLSELYRMRENTLINEINSKKHVCTMKSSVNLLQLPGHVMNSFKNPKLKELYKYLFNQEQTNCHNAKYDVINTARCYFELRNRNIL